MSELVSQKAFGPRRPARSIDPPATFGLGLTMGVFAVIGTVLWRAVMRPSRSHHHGVVGAAVAELLAAVGVSGWTIWPAMLGNLAVLLAALDVSAWKIWPRLRCKAWRSLCSRRAR